MIDLAGFTLRDLLEAFADVVADKIAERDQSLISQHDRRGLGKRRHIEACKRRMREGTGDAWKRDRDYLMTPAAVRDELTRFGAREVERDEPSTVRARAKTAATAGKSEAEAAELAALSRKLDAELAAAARPGRRH